LQKKLQNKMKEKTEKNPKKAGRPKLEPTIVRSVRVKESLDKEMCKRFSNKYVSKLWPDFCRVYLLNN
jgi:hypothetical protein